MSTEMVGVSGEMVFQECVCSVCVQSIDHALRSLRGIRQVKL